MAKSLLGTGRHTVTAITRADSSSKLPDGVKVAKVDYDDDQSLVDALRGHDALVITLSVFAPKDTEDKLIKAAADANVPWVLPNEWCVMSFLRSSFCRHILQSNVCPNGLAGLQTLPTKA